MENWIVYSIVTAFFVIWFIIIVIRNRKNKSGLCAESEMYKELFNAFDKKNNPFRYKKYDEYVNIIKKSEISLIEHTIAIVEGNIQTETVNSVIMAIAPTIFSLCSFFVAGQFGLEEGREEVIAKGVYLLILGIYIVCISPAYVSVKRQKYFLKLMKFELDKKKEQKTAYDNEELIFRIQSLEKKIEDTKKEIENLKKKKTKGIHITFEK